MGNQQGPTKPCIHRTRVRLPLLLPTAHHHHKHQMSIKLDGPELMLNSNFIKHPTCVLTGYYRIISQVSQSFATQKWLKTFECLPMEACTWPQMTDPLKHNGEADLPQWGEVWFNDKARITNIFSNAEMADRNRKRGRIYCSFA